MRDNPSEVQRLRDLRLLASERLRILAQLGPFAPIVDAASPGRVAPILADGQVVMEEIRATVGEMTSEENRLLVAGRPR